MKTPARAGLAILAAVPVLVSCGGLPDEIHEQAKARRLEAAGVEAFDSSGRYDLAGMSATQIVDLEPVSKKDLEGDTLGPEFMAFHARCSACHVAPAPRSKTAGEWASVMSRMAHNQEEAGLLPMRPEDRELALRFLQRHAKDAH